MTFSAVTFIITVLDVIIFVTEKQGGVFTNSSFSIAVHALVCLSHMNDVLSSEELAKNICTNPVLVRKVMSKLKKAGIVDTKGGNSGGYILTADAEKLTLDEIAEALSTQFVVSPWRSGDMDRECLISSGMGKVMEDLFNNLDKECRKKLQGITVADIEKKLLLNGKGRKKDEKT